MPLKELSTFDLEGMQLPVDLNLNQHPISSSSFSFPWFFLFFLLFDFSLKFFTFTESGLKPIFIFININTQSKVVKLIITEKTHFKDTNFKSSKPSTIEKQVTMRGNQWCPVVKFSQKEFWERESQTETRLRKRESVQHRAVWAVWNSKQGSLGKREERSGHNSNLGIFHFPGNK